MIRTTTDKAINLSQLDKELGGFGLCMNEENANAKIVAIPEHSPVTLIQLETGIAAHKAVFVETTLEEKLAIVGIDIDELKAALM